MALVLVKPLSDLQVQKNAQESTELEVLGLSFQRGAINELTGKSSVGRISIALMILTKLSIQGEVCAVVDVTDSFDPVTASLGNCSLENLLWVKCNSDVEKAFTSVDYLIQAKGFGAIWLNLSNVPIKGLRQIPRSYWYRFRTKLRDSPTILIVTSGDISIADSAASVSYELNRKQAVWSGIGRFKLLREFDLQMDSRKQFAESISTSIEFSYEDV